MSKWFLTHFINKYFLWLNICHTIDSIVNFNFVSDLVPWLVKCNGNKSFSRDPRFRVDASDQFGGVKCDPSEWVQCGSKIHSNWSVPFWSHVVPTFTALKLAWSFRSFNPFPAYPLVWSWALPTAERQQRGEKGRSTVQWGLHVGSHVKIYNLHQSPVKTKRQAFDLTCHHGMKSNLSNLFN